MLLGVGGTIYNQYTITTLLNLGIPTHKMHQLATKLHCHAIKSLNKTNYNSTTTTMIIGDLMGGVTGRAAGFRMARCRPDRMADNSPDPH